MSIFPLFSGLPQAFHGAWNLVAKLRVLLFFLLEMPVPCRIRRQIRREELFFFNAASTASYSWLERSRKVEGVWASLEELLDYHGVAPGTRTKVATFLTVIGAELVTLKLESGKYLRSQPETGAQCNVFSSHLYNKATKDFDLRIFDPCQYGDHFLWWYLNSYPRKRSFMSMSWRFQMSAWLQFGW